MDNEIKHITRFSKPTKTDRVPFGTWLTYQDPDDKQEHYLQMSKDETNPSWVRLGEVLEQVYLAKLEDDKFIKKIITAYIAHKQIS